MRFHYWRDKRQHEVDFVLVRRGKSPIAIECKWSASGFDPSGLLAFRRVHNQGQNYVVATDVDRRFKHAYADCEVNFVNLKQLLDKIG